jgi:hypothetical protein
MPETEKQRRKAELHEILAVDASTKGEFEKVIVEAANTFSKKADHFQGHHRKLKMNDAARETEELAGETHKEMVTTVFDKLKYMSKACINYFDVLLQKEATNQTAKADLIVDGEVLIENAPATWLLGMEDRLKKIRSVLDTIPTLQPGIKWEQDPTHGDDVWRSAFPETKEKTEQTIKPFVLYEATKDHPAQVDKLVEHIVVGLFSIDRWSGTFSPAQKSRLMARMDKLIRGCMQARQRANKAEVIQIKAGKKIFDYLLGDAKTK